MDRYVTRHEQPQLLRDEGHQKQKKIAECKVSAEAGTDVAKDAKVSRLTDGWRGSSRTCRTWWSCVEKAHSVTAKKRCGGASRCWNAKRAA
mmetsp:Transcript_7209/g.44877  ORF Transcript_7209/g.44877 Transcript_7209/m.44877 type:complete len:91 (+) Transcript_7209:3647-3919(+)